MDRALAFGAGCWRFNSSWAQIFLRSLGGRKIIKRAVLILLGVFCFWNLSFAQDKARLEDKIIGGTFKSLAKAFVLVIDLEKLKKNNIEKLKKMDAQKFSKRYNKAYPVLKDLPTELKNTYGVSEGMSKERSIENIASLNKQRINQIIDSVPDAFIARQFKQYLREKKEELKNSNIAQQINKFWSKTMEKTGYK